MTLPRGVSFRSLLKGEAGTLALNGCRPLLRNENAKLQQLEQSAGEDKRKTIRLGKTEELSNCFHYN